MYPEVISRKFDDKVTVTLKRTADTTGRRQIRVTCQSQMRLIRVESTFDEVAVEVHLET